MLQASDLTASQRFYETVLPTLADRWPDFALAQAGGNGSVTRRLHIGFVAPSRAHVDEFWRVGTEAGYRDDGAPGPRPHRRPPVDSHSRRGGFEALLRDPRRRRGL